MNNKYHFADVVALLIKLRDELGHEPTVLEIDDCPYLPSARQIQRRWGGVAAVRKAAGFKQNDHTSGNTRSDTAHAINQRANKYHLKYINDLFDRYHDMDGLQKSVTREFVYQQWLPDEGYYKNIACDVAITNHKNNHVILIDFFYPQDHYSYGGCVRMKRSKLNRYPVSLFNCTHTVVFVCMNQKFDQQFIDNHVTNKKDIKILSLDSFTKEFLPLT